MLRRHRSLRLEMLERRYALTCDGTDPDCVEDPPTDPPPSDETPPDDPPPSDPPPDEPPPEDVNDDGHIAPNDALEVANALFDEGDEFPVTEDTTYLDVTGDGVVSAEDFQAVIDALSTGDGTVSVDDANAIGDALSAHGGEFASTDPTLDITGDGIVSEEDFHLTLAITDAFNEPANDPFSAPPAYEIVDVNDDGEVNPVDAMLIVDAMHDGTTDPLLDVNGDGEINVADFDAVLTTMQAVGWQSPYPQDMNNLGDTTPPLNPENELILLSTIFDASLYRYQVELGPNRLMGQGWGGNIADGVVGPAAPDCVEVVDGIKNYAQKWLANELANGLDLTHYDFATVTVNEWPFEHMYFGIVDRDTQELLYFADPWRDGSYMNFRPVGQDPNVWFGALEWGRDIQPWNVPPAPAPDPTVNYNYFDHIWWGYTIHGP